MEVYKSEDKKIIYEYIKKLREETEETNKFLDAIERELIRGYEAEEKLNKIKKGEIEIC